MAISSSAAATALVFALLALLGSPRYRDRELAQAALQRIMPLAEEYLRQVVDNDAICVEQQRRAALLLERYFRERAESLAAKMKPAGWSALPWIDSLPLDYPNRTEVINFYLDRARLTHSTEQAKGWPDYREATRLFLVALLSDPQTYTTAPALLETMAVRECEWVAQYGERYQVQLPLVQGGK